MSPVVVCDYGAGNTRSVRASLGRLGIRTVLSADPVALLNAQHVVLPGVGSARSAMEHLIMTEADEALRRRFAAGRSILGICLGMQLAMQHSEEDGGVRTLGLLDGVVSRMTSDRVPRIGWSTVEPWGETYYFAHSYSCVSPHTIATAEGLAAAVASGPFQGVQFHPEKSGVAGLRWLASCLSVD